ncbi:MAG: hypothetical protein ACREUE_14740, partial [Panacagrimonas sp.]
LKESARHRGRPDRVLRVAVRYDTSGPTGPHPRGPVFVSEGSRKEAARRRVTHRREINMNALQRRPHTRPPRLRRPALVLAAWAFLMLLAGVVFVAAAWRDALRSPGATSSRTGESRGLAFAHGLAGEDADTSAALRRWPVEIEHLLSSMPSADDNRGMPPTIETDQRCSRVEDGLAHCVMLECQTAGEQTACFEMVVTARRLREPPDTMREGAQEEDGVGASASRAPSLVNIRHPWFARGTAAAATTRF